MKLSYAKAGVSIDAGNELIERIKPAIKRTQRSEVLRDIGGFAALASVPESYRDPIIVTCTDGVGTKVEIASRYNCHDTIGQDLVAMCVNDLVTTGAEPFLFLDYFATGSLNLDVAERVIKGIAQACELAGCALPGGETAEMPGVYPPNVYDLAGFCVGIVERDEIIDGSQVDVSNVLIGLHSTGPHSNGYSLIREILKSSEPPDDVLHSILAPTRIYVRSVLQNKHLLTGMAHITGGGILENIPRMFSERYCAQIEIASVEPIEPFAWIAEQGSVAKQEMLRTFNCGFGFVVTTAAENVELVLKKFVQEGERASVIGVVDSIDADVRKDCVKVSERGTEFS